MTLFLTPEELEELTGYKTSSRQRLALAEMGVAFRSRPYDGFPLVERYQFETGTKLTPAKRRREPNLDFLREGKL